jgi:tetratricopeptide (TPR) repeat protein
LPHLSEQRDTREQAIDLRLALRNALLPTGDAARILECLREAEGFVQALDDPRRLGQISGFLSVHFRNMGAYDQALASAERALALAGASEDAAGRSRANLYLGAAYWAQGHYLHAIECLRQTVAALHGAQRRERLGQTNLPSVQSLAFLAACHAELGMFEEGATFGQEGLQVAESVASPGSIMWALWGLGLVSLCRGNLPKSLPLLERAMAICQEADLRLFVPRMAAALGGAYTLAGRVADAAALLTTAMDLTMGPEMAGFRGLCGIALGEVHLRAGRLEDAYALVERTLMLVRAHHERGNEAYALRLLGEVAAQRDPSDSVSVESHYRGALGLAEERGMRPLIAHCHFGLGKLYRGTGDREQAQEHLTTATAMYRKMDMRFWLEKVRAEGGGRE